MEGILFDVEAGVRYVITDKTVRGGEAIKRRVEQMRGTARNTCFSPFASRSN